MSVKRILIAVVLTLLLMHVAVGETPLPTLGWLGHSCFLITSPEGKKLLIDPFSKQNIKYPQPAVEADVVLVTHEHFDHNNVGAVRGNPTVIRGLKNDAKDFNDVDRTVAGFHIKSVRCYHDKQKGAARGKNAIFIITVGNTRFAHLGDLGHILDKNTVASLGRIDVLMIPVGGKYTIEPDEAWNVVGQIKPKIIIPMHYKTPKVDIPLKPVENFTKGHLSIVKKLDVKTTPVAIPKTQQIWIFPLP